MKMILDADRKKLLANGAKSAKDPSFSAAPVVKFFSPVGSATWLISEIDPENPDIAFGLCDLGQGSPELGSVSLSELFALRLPLGLKVERDMHWTASKSLEEYADEARAAGRIIS